MNAMNHRPPTGGTPGGRIRPGAREPQLDGMRGLAALAVALSHVAAMSWIPYEDGPAAPSAWAYVLWHLGAPAVDLSRFLHAPAGAAGHIAAKGPHLVTPDGSRFRIWGVNICGPDCFPAKEEADREADRLAKLGVNCVRFHHMDSTWSRIPARVAPRPSCSSRRSRRRSSSRAVTSDSRLRCSSRCRRRAASAGAT